MDIIQDIELRVDSPFTTPVTPLEKEIEKGWLEELNKERWDYLKFLKKIGIKSLVNTVRVCTAIGASGSVVYLIYKLATDFPVVEANILAIVLGIIIAVALLMLFYGTVGALTGAIIWFMLIHIKFLWQAIFYGHGKLLKEKRKKLASDHLFFYDEVGNYLSKKEKSIDDRVIDIEATLKKEFKEPRRKLGEKIDQGYDDRFMLIKTLGAENPKLIEFDNSLEILKKQHKTPNQRELELAQELKVANNQLALLRSVASKISSKKNFYDENALLFDRIEQINNLARSHGYESLNASNSNPVLNSLKDELVEINEELSIILIQANEINENHILTANCAPKQIVAG